MKENIKLIYLIALRRTRQTKHNDADNNFFLFTPNPSNRKTFFLRFPIPSSAITNLQWRSLYLIAPTDRSCHYHPRLLLIRYYFSNSSKARIIEIVWATAAAAAVWVRTDQKALGNPFYSCSACRIGTFTSRLADENARALGSLNK